ncbi:MAG: DUF1572 family protein [Ginsengibacter sp.]
MLTSITALFERDLNRLIKEIQSYKDDNDIWRIKEGISNSAGNLALHLIGNLNHFVGATLGNTGYVRDREKEFSDKNVPQKKLIEDIGETIVVVRTALKNLSKDDLEKDFPHSFNNIISSTEFVLLHLLGHLNYHLGQINYHRRLIH